MVAAKVPAAADAGAEILARGGNAVDAAAATAFASGVAEPYMSGIGGGGFMLIHPADGRAPISIDYSMVAPLAASPDLFSLDPAGGTDDFFGWQRVVDAANLRGPRAVGVPGTIAGLAAAVERYGRLSLAEVMAPAIALARDGVEVSWFDTLMIAQHQELLQRYPESAATFLDDGRVPVTTPADTPVLRQPDLARTLEAVAAGGPAVFYGGAVGDELAAHVQRHGGILSAEDLAGYQVRIVDDLSATSFRDVSVYTPPSPCGSTTILETLRILDGFDHGSHNAPQTLDILAQASRLAFADRYAYLGAFTDDPDGALALLDADFIETRRQDVRPGRAEPPRRGELPRREPATGRPDPDRPGGSTTHLSAADADGMMVSVTQTLLQLFGSGVVAGETGILLNNAMGWFDPVPGRSASLASGRRPMTNMSPLLVADRGGSRLALGASGGRKIIQAVLQVLLNVVDHGLTMQDAVSAPRIDCSGTEILVNSRLDSAAIQGLRAAGHPVAVVDDSFTARRFASPACIRIDPTDGRRYSGLDPYYPAAAAGR